MDIFKMTVTVAVACQVGSWYEINKKKKRRKEGSEFYIWTYNDVFGGRKKRDITTLCRNFI